jgi:hypothetical protein
MRLASNALFSLARRPGNNKYLVNSYVVPLGESSPPPSLKAADNRAFEANVRQDLQDKYLLYERAERLS